MPGLQGCVLPMVIGLSGLWGGGTDTPLPQFPLEAAGEIRFTADGALLLDQEMEPEVVFYVAVPERDMTFVALENRPGDWMQLDAAVDFLSEDRESLVRMTSRLEIPHSAEEESPLPARRIIRLRAPLETEVAGFEVALQDQNAMRRGLLPILRGTHKQGVARGLLPPAAIEDGRGLGGPVFLWGCDTEAVALTADGWSLGPAAELREALDPHPARSYGLLRPALGLYVELYGLAQTEVDLVLRVATVPEDRTILAQQSRVRPAWRRCGALRTLDVSRLAAGTYTVEIQARPAASPAQAVRSGPSTVSATSTHGHNLAQVAGHFQVHWDAKAWQVSQQERMEEASVLFQGEAWERFVSLEPGRQEALLDSLWTDVGGVTQGMNRAEIKALFRQRLRVADARYGGLRRGCLADRGRVYIHFGEPDEIHKELAPQEQDLIYNFLQREISDSEAAAAGGRPRVHWMDGSAYQVWYYTHRGSPLLPVQAMRVHGGALRFIFVDEMGNGDYRLIYTNLFGGTI